ALHRAHDRDLAHLVRELREQAVRKVELGIDFTDVEVARRARVFLEVERVDVARSEEHTSELQSLTNLVCRLLLEKKKKYTHQHVPLTHIRRRGGEPKLGAHQQAGCRDLTGA